MSVKHIKNEFDKICKDYHEMLEVLHELEDAVSENVISEERFKELSAPIETVKTNYLRWSYMMYLLDLPNNKNKQKKYRGQKKQPPYVDREENATKTEELKNNIREIKQ